MKRTVKIILILIIILLVASFFVYRSEVFKKESPSTRSSALPKAGGSEPSEEVEVEIFKLIEEIKVEVLDEMTGSTESSDSVLEPKTESKTPEQDLGSVDEVTKKVPTELVYNVPFASQAPFANWDMPYQEACEEAVMIMAAKYFKSEKLDAQIMDEEILKLVAWEEKNNYPIDLTADQIVEVLKKYFFINAYTDTETNVQNIKDLLNQKKLIIIPAAGRQLGNPYFTGVGPLYHNLVIIGYDEDEFITNDPGTRRGEKYRYKYFDLINAIHDWNGGVRVFKDPRPEPDITKGKKVMVVID